MFGIRTDNDKIWGSDASFWSNKPQVEIYKGTVNKAVPKDYINQWESHHKCGHEGCFKDGSVICHIPDYPDRLPDSPRYDTTNINVLEHLCPDHAYEAGYCVLCGDFWGGIESFDFNNPQKLCENCLDQVKTELGEYETEEAEYYGEYY